MRNSHSSNVSHKVDLYPSDAQQTFFLFHRNMSASDSIVPPLSPGVANQAIPVGSEVTPYCVDIVFIVFLTSLQFNPPLSMSFYICDGPTYVSCPLSCSLKLTF